MPRSLRQKRHSYHTSEGGEFRTSLNSRTPVQSSMAREPRFIADAMLGRLARWLRLLGFDTLYHAHGDDREIIRKALQDDRCILTRDTHFLRRRNLKNLFMIHSDNPLEQVNEVIRSVPIGEFNRPRCTRCNATLKEVHNRDYVRGRVPEYVFFSCGSFLECGTCGNVYWEGTHLKRFRTLLSGIVPVKDHGAERT